MEDRDNFEMTVAEVGRLEQLEGIIAKNFQGFYAVGCALAEIRAERLYRMTHNTFEDYCRARFEVARRTAYQYIEAASVIDNVRRGAQIKLLPLNERQARPLTRLEPDAQVEAWEKVVKSAPFDGGITAQHVSHVVDDIIGKRIQKKADNIKSKTSDSPVVSKEFKDVSWALVDVVRIEVSKPLKVKTKQIMIETLQRIINLLAE
ncbi:MAG: hypothetical protein JRD05_00570 [Deltaproteobacteria bacterium]|nr:hypothetical protein [Deltaproteobacteria bacterium]